MPKFKANVIIRDRDGAPVSAYRMEGTGRQATYTEEFVWHHGGRPLSQRDIDDLGYVVTALPSGERERDEALADFDEEQREYDRTLVAQRALDREMRSRIISAGGIEGERALRRGLGRLGER